MRFYSTIIFTQEEEEEKNRIHSSSIADNKAHYVPRRISLRALNALAFFQYLALQKENCILALQSAKVGPLRERGEYKKPTVTDCKEAIIEMEENCKELCFQYVIVDENFCGRLYRKLAPCTSDYS